MASTDAPVIHIPDAEELEAMLSVSRDLPERVRYVRRLLQPAEAAGRAIENLEREITRLRTANAAQAEEVRALRIKLGDLSPAERAALEQRYDMLGKLNRARGVLDIVERDVADAMRKMREALKK